MLACVNRFQVCPHGTGGGSTPEGRPQTGSERPQTSVESSGPHELV